MKRTRNLINGLMAGAVAFAMVCPLAAQTVTQGSARVVRMKGDARYTVGAGTFKPLKLGDVLKPGTIVQTSREKGAFVDLVLLEGAGEVAMPASSGGAGAPGTMAYQPKAEQNIVRITENSALGIDKLTSTQTGAGAVTETQLDLRAGRILGSVKKMSAASKYEIKFPNGVAGIRGTSYEFTAEGVLKITIGQAIIAYSTPAGVVQTQIVNGGQTFDARTGKFTPIPPAELRSMDNLFSTMAVVQTAAPLRSPVDPTIQFISQTRATP